MRVTYFGKKFTCDLLMSKESFDTFKKNYHDEKVIIRSQGEYRMVKVKDLKFVSNNDKETEVPL